MKLNKKGLTLVELIISVVLIVVVMFFMYRLLNDVNAEKNDNSYAQANTVNRGEIIKEIEDDLVGKVITNVAVTNPSDGITITLTLGSQSAKIEATKDKFKYTNPEGELRQWTMESCTLNTDNVGVKYSESANGTYTLLLTLAVYTDNDQNRVCNNCSNNVVDDIIISHMANGSISALKNKTCLGKNC